MLATALLATATDGVSGQHSATKLWDPLTCRGRLDGGGGTAVSGEL